jgi:Putative collagen-binding domain of a collagenase
MYVQSKYALDFFYNDLSFWEMSSNENRVSSVTDWLLSSLDDTVHVVYRRSTTSTSDGINLDGFTGTYSVKWYNPRSGGSLQNGSIASIVADGNDFVSFGNPPRSDGKDWVVLIKKI